jgi:hypothetical protein
VRDATVDPPTLAKPRRSDPHRVPRRSVRRDAPDHVIAEPMQERSTILDIAAKVDCNRASACNVGLAARDYPELAPD